MEPKQGALFSLCSNYFEDFIGICLLTISETASVNYQFATADHLYWPQGDRGKESVVGIKSIPSPQRKAFITTLCPSLLHLVEFSELQKSLLKTIKTF